MRSKGFSLISVLLLCALQVSANYSLSGVVIDAGNGQPISNAEVYNRTLNLLTSTNAEGFFEMSDLEAGTYELVIVSLEYETLEKVVKIAGDMNLTIPMTEFSQVLSEVVVSERREEIFALNRLRPVEGTAIYAGKKTEVVLVDQLVGNIAANNPRQIFGQVVGLNIYESIDAGLQLNIGGRGLDPNRTANFNTRQNGYDISADVLGYPESYYTPPAEALSEIQVIRGAASLQYGTQFGGLLNFKMKRPSKRVFELITRQSVGSFGLFNSFNSISGTKGKLSYYTYYNRKQGDGFRANSEFESNNFFTSLGWEFNEQTRLTFETTYLNYLAQQPGGLTDTQFALDPTFSNRTRNWFEVNWKLYALKFQKKFSVSSDFSLTVFRLNASRNALGFRGNPILLNSNPVSSEDPLDQNGEFIFARDLIKGKFKNWGLEARYLTRYQLLGKDAVLLLGTKLYKANNESFQGPGSFGPDANFNFIFLPDYPNQSAFDFPNANLSIFGEHIWFLGEKFSITPGFRFERIVTESEGTYNQVNFDNAGNPISNQVLMDNRKLDRNFILLGLGASYEPNENLEVYANISENYRSVTFSDIRVVNPSFIIDTNISDERGYTFDLGFRGKYRSYISYDIGGFGLVYNDRIGIIFDDRANRVRKNIGKALIYGLEAFTDLNLIQALKIDSRQHKLNWFANTAITTSEYVESEENNVKGKEVEFIPRVNIKTGLRFGYKNLLGSVQYTYLSEQFTDVENSGVAPAGDSRNGLIGSIPSYSIMDLSVSYKIKKVKIETGVNNLLDKEYFTRRATGYPGPGIITSDPRNFYLTIQVKID